MKLSGIPNSMENMVRSSYADAASTGSGVVAARTSIATMAAQVPSRATDAMM